jgi:hypothetical protein
MDEQEKKAFDFAADLTKQLITLSTSIVTLTFLFSKDSLEPKWLAVTIWTFFLLSTVCGVWVLMGLTGTLAPVEDKATAEPTKVPARLGLGDSVRNPSKCQIITFGLAIFLTMIYVPRAVLIHQTSAPATDHACTCSTHR